MLRIVLLFSILLSAAERISAAEPDRGGVKVGAERTAEYLPALRDRRVAVLANHTAMVGDRHLVDMLCDEGIAVAGIFSPEHGFRGGADAGEHVGSSVDEKTGIPIWSLYDGGSGRPLP